MSVNVVWEPFARTVAERKLSYLSQYEQKIPTYDDKTVHRICVLCKEDQGMSKELRSRQMTFGRNSVVAKKWLRSLYGDDLDEGKVDKEYAEALQRLQS